MNKSFTKAVFVTGALLASTGALSETIRKTVPACISEELLDELVNYAVKGDRNGGAQLLISGSCTMLPAGAEVSVIKSGFTKISVRYQGIKWFTVAEAIR